MTATHGSRSFFVEKPGGRLEAILWKPSFVKRPPLAAVVCHPHPLFGGTMHNKVVYQTAKTLDALDILKAEFPGVPLLLAGFSFGAWVGLPAGCQDSRVSHLIGLGIPVNDSNFSFLCRCDKPRLFVHGSNDEYGAIERVKTLVASLPGENHLVVVEGADHFFAGKLDQLDGAINTWFTDHIFRLRH